MQLFRMNKDSYFYMGSSGVLWGRLLAKMCLYYGLVTRLL